MNNEDCFENIFNGCKEFLIIFGGVRLYFFFAVCLTSWAFRGTVSPPPRRDPGVESVVAINLW